MVVMVGGYSLNSFMPLQVCKTSTISLFPTHTYITEGGGEEENKEMRGKHKHKERKLKI